MIWRHRRSLSLSSTHTRTNMNKRAYIRTRSIHGKLTRHAHIILEKPYQCQPYISQTLHRFSSTCCDTIGIWFELRLECALATPPFVAFSSKNSRIAARPPVQPYWFHSFFHFKRSLIEQHVRIYIMVNLYRSEIEELRHRSVCVCCVWYVRKTEQGKEANSKVRGIGDIWRGCNVRYYA